MVDQEDHRRRSSPWPSWPALVVFFALAVNGSSTDTNVSQRDAVSGPEQVEVPKGPVLAVGRQRPLPPDDRRDQVRGERAGRVPHPRPPDDLRQRPGPPDPLRHRDRRRRCSTTPATATFVERGQCFYWLHTHAADGIIHIESPTQTTYTWASSSTCGASRSTAGQVGPAIGPLKVYVDGKPYTGDPRAIALGAHTQIQLDIGSPGPGAGHHHLPVGHLSTLGGSPPQGLDRSRDRTVLPGEDRPAPPGRSRRP